MDLDSSEESIIGFDGKASDQGGTGVVVEGEVGNIKRTIGD